MSQNNNSSWEPYSFNEPKLTPLKNPTILAFSCYFHDSSACILKNGKIVAAFDEERFTRKKHDANFPINSIKYCLKTANVKTVDFVAFYENPEIKWQRILETLNKNPPSKETYDKIHEIWQELKSKEKIQKTFNTETGLNNQIVFLDHHLCHAASSYFISGFNEAAIVTLDGVGERITTAYGHGKFNEMKLEKCINFPHSIGLLYTALTVFLGFKANDHEYKVMGLAPYGIMNREQNPYYKKLRKSIELKEDGSFLLNMEYFGHENFEALPYTQAMTDLLGLKPSPKSGLITSEQENLAAALQLVTEDTVFNLLNHVQKTTGHEKLCLSGGVALNSVLNGKILSRTQFKQLFIQPSAGDSGTVIGAVKYIQHLVDKNSPTEKISHSSYGLEYTSNEIETFLKEKNIVYRKFESEDILLMDIANLLKEKAVIGWFQGKMEWGPRALGNRSILASPLFSDMRDILNSKVKHRELFRPFAPVICIDDAPDFFHCDLPVPEPTDYMLMVYPIKESERKKIPAVTHVDGSGRLQTIRKNQNPLYYKLIKKFGELTGIPILVNTSFNIRGEPIVCSPQDAFRCMMGTEIDYLVIDHFLIKRAENLKESWTPIIND
ncbi:MAG: carbamoyltransferase C-terminal domain-containing protein [Chlamydiota bacterium]